MQKGVTRVVRLCVILGFVVMGLGISVVQSQKIPEIGGWMIKELDFTDDQMTKMETINSDREKKNIRLEANMRIAQMELGELLNQADVNEKAIMDKIAEVNKIDSELMQNRVTGFIATKKLLTPEQKEKLAKLKSGKMKRFAEMREKQEMKERKKKMRSEDGDDEECEQHKPAEKIKEPAKPVEKK